MKLVQNEKVTVERLGSQSEQLSSVITKLDQNDLKSANTSPIDFENVLKYSFANSELQYYFFNIEDNSTQNILAIQRENDLIFLKVTLSSFNGIKSFSMASLSDDNLLTIYLDEEDNVIDTEKNVNNPLFLKIKQLKAKSALKSAVAEHSTCEERTDNYWDCIECAIRELGSDYLTIIACGLMPQACLAAAGIHCL